MLTVFSYQVLRLLRDRILLVWTLGFPIVLSLIFMAQFSNLNEAFEANPMNFGVVQDGAYRADPGLDAVVERISADDADPHLITKVTHSTASEAEAAAKRGETNGYLAVESGEPVLHVTQKGNDAETTRVLRVVMDSYTQRRAEYEALIKAGTAPERLATLETNQSFTRSLSVTPSPVKPETHYYFALLAFACGMGTTVAMVAVQGIMAISPLGARQTMAGLSRWKVLTATLAASWVCVLACLLIAFTFIATVVDVDFGPHTVLCLVDRGLQPHVERSGCRAGDARTSGGRDDLRDHLPAVVVHRPVRSRGPVPGHFRREPCPAAGAGQSPVADRPLLLRAPLLRLPGALHPQLRSPAGHDVPVPYLRPDPRQEDDP